MTSPKSSTASAAARASTRARSTNRSAATPTAACIPGPVGAVLTPALWGQGEWSDLPHASSLCGACRDVCPVRIDIPKLLLRLRAEGDADGTNARLGRPGHAHVPAWPQYGPGCSTSRASGLGSGHKPDCQERLDFAAARAAGRMDALARLPADGEGVLSGPLEEARLGKHRHDAGRTRAPCAPPSRTRSARRRCPTARQPIPGIFTPAADTATVASRPVSRGSSKRSAASSITRPRPSEVGRAHC